MPIQLWQSHAKAELSSVSVAKLFDAGQPFYTWVAQTMFQYIVLLLTTS
jgi:hypothetical protein